MNIVVTCDGVVSSYTMAKNVEMLMDELAIKNVHIEEYNLEEVKNKKADIFIASEKSRKNIEYLDGLIILLENTMDKQEITLKLLKALKKLAIIKE